MIFNLALLCLAVLTIANEHGDVHSLTRLPAEIDSSKFEPARLKFLFETPDIEQEELEESISSYLNSILDVNPVRGFFTLDGLQHCGTTLLPAGIVSADMLVYVSVQPGETSQSTAVACAVGQNGNVLVARIVLRGV